MLCQFKQKTDNTELEKPCFPSVVYLHIFRDAGMRHMVGDKWVDLFDVVIINARKPDFFTSQKRFVWSFISCSQYVYIKL